VTIEDEAAALAWRLKFMRSAEAAAGVCPHQAAKLWVACLASSFSLSALVVWAVWPAQLVPEVVAAAPAVKQADGSVIAERAPDAHPAPPVHMLPKGSVEVRREKIVAAPAAGASSVEVDLSLVRVDGGQRVIASSPDGTINQAIDIPIEAAMIPPPPKRWAAGLGYTTEREVGVWLERDVGRLRVGAEVLKGQGRPRAEIRVGVAF
jgi:hypothetical protein